MVEASLVNLAELIVLVIGVLIGVYELRNISKTACAQTLYPNIIIGFCEKVIPMLDRFKEYANDPEIGKSIKYLYNVTKRKYPNIKPAGIWRGEQPEPTT